MATGETLSFETFRNQSGKYWCIVKNGLNLTVNASVNLDVQCMYDLTSLFYVSAICDISYKVKEKIISLLLSSAA